MIESHSRYSELKDKSGILLACFVGMMFGIAAIPFYTLGVFAGPVIDTTGWSMQQYQTAFTFIIFGTLFGPAFGHLCDKYGARPVAAISTITFALSLGSLGIAAELGLFAFYAAWAVMAVVGQGTGPVIWTHVIGHHFRTNRGLAFGIVLAGSGFFAIFGPLLSVHLIDLFGMQAAYGSLAILVLLISLPLVVVFLRTPAITAEPSENSKAELEAEGVPVSAALQNYRLYLIAMSFLVIAFCVSGLISNMIPILQSGGMSLSESGKLVGLIGISVIGGRLIIGALLDRYWAPVVAAISLVCPALACIVLLDGLTSWNAAIAVLLVGFAAGAEFDIVAFLAAKYFGLLAYGKIYGLLYIALFIGAAFAPPVFGLVFDSRGSYHQVLLFCVVVIPIAACSLLALGAYPDFEKGAQH